jgi:hypothetical protein
MVRTGSVSNRENTKFTKITKKKNIKKKISSSCAS